MGKGIFLVCRHIFGISTGFVGFSSSPFPVDCGAIRLSWLMYPENLKSQRQDNVRPRKGSICSANRVRNIPKCTIRGASGRQIVLTPQWAGNFERQTPHCPQLVGIFPQQLGNLPAAERKDIRTALERAPASGRKDPRSPLERSPQWAGNILPIKSLLSVGSKAL